MYNFTYCVITKIPKPWEGDDGNLASASFAHPDIKYPDSDLYVQNNTYGGKDEDNPNKHKPRAVTYKEMNKVLGRNWRDFSFMVPVFEIGEIVILDEPDGREVAGKQRAPRKWYIEYEEFDDIDKAVKRAQEVLRVEEVAMLKKHGIEA